MSEWVGRWRVERAGTSSGWLTGWYVFSPTGEGWHFDKHDQAIMWAQDQAVFDSLFPVAGFEVCS